MSFLTEAEKDEIIRFSFSHLIDVTRAWGQKFPLSRLLPTISNRWMTNDGWRRFLSKRFPPWTCSYNDNWTSPREPLLSICFAGDSAEACSFLFLISFRHLPNHPAQPQPGIICFQIKLTIPLSLSLTLSNMISKEELATMMFRVKKCLKQLQGSSPWIRTFGVLAVKMKGNPTPFFSSFGQCYLDIIWRLFGGI